MKAKTARAHDQSRIRGARAWRPRVSNGVDNGFFDPTEASTDGRYTPPIPPDPPDEGPDGGVGGEFVPRGLLRGPADPAEEPRPEPRTGQLISLSPSDVGSLPSSSRDLQVLYDKDGPFAAELRILATRLDDLKSTFGYKGFLITSVGEGEGKTVTAANLALVMSEDPERRIALVDANFRSPRAAELFNLDPSRGLLAAVSGQRSLRECVARVMGRNLIVLHAGGTHPNPSAVLSDPRLKMMITELTHAVDHVIIDAPAALPHADVPLLAQHADAVFMVVSAHRTGRAKLDKALDTIGRSRIGGAIFIDREPEKRRFGASIADLELSWLPRMGRQRREKTER